MSRSPKMPWIPVSLVVALVGVVGLSFAQDADVDGAGERPRVLVTNDDGFDTPGLRVLVKELSEFADIFVSAPAGNRSGTSQSITYLSSPLAVRDVEIDGAVKAVAIDGTPADAAHFGIMYLGQDAPFDLLVSGMNHGANVGEVSHESGTVGAAMEGAFRGVPSIAVSVDARTRDFEAPAAFARRFAERWLDQGTDAGVVYSINIPRRGESGWAGVRAAPMGGAYLKADSYVELEAGDEGRVFRARVEMERDFPAGSDSEAYFAGYVTITPMRFDWTHREALAEVTGWGLGSE